MTGHPVDRVVGDHDRAATRPHGTLEGGEEVGEHPPPAHVRLARVAPARRRAVGGEVLGAGEHAVGVGEGGTLQAPHRGGPEVADPQGIFPEALVHPAPAQVAGRVEHRRVGLVRSRGGREERVAVDRVHAEEQRDAEPGLADRDPLHPGDERQVLAVAQRADVLDPDTAFHVPAGVHLADLADLLGRRHAREQICGPFPDGQGGVEPGGRRADRRWMLRHESQRIQPAPTAQ
jgi:hypothetical protein